MNASPVAALIRGWVDLYTRGMPAPVRAERRDEVDDDLWCQHEEAAVMGRSTRSLGAEILLRLLLGMPADVSWRLSHGRAASGLERSSSMSTRVIGALAVIGGASWGMAAALVLVAGPSVVDGTEDYVTLALGLGGGVAFAAAAIGMAWRFQDQLSTIGALGGVLGGLGVLLATLGAYPAYLLFPVGSAALAWDLARTGILSRGLAIVHAVSAIGILVPFVGILIDYRAMASGPLVVLAIPYMLTWVAIGVSLVRGVPRAHEPATGV
jgi:hypothetical protein